MKIIYGGRLVSGHYTTGGCHAETILQQSVKEVIAHMTFFLRTPSGRQQLRSPCEWQMVEVVIF